MLIGIDPGWTNLGIAIASDEGQEIFTATIDPSSLGIDGTVGWVVEQVLDASDTIPSSDKHWSLVMERYVAYKGVHNPRSEDILMLIGALNYGLRDVVSDRALVRAIDWKPALCKYLFKERGFRNPSKTFDKEFSMAAAEAIAGKPMESDHVADAMCLAYFPKIKEKSK